jgi:hypothetical protein
MGHTWLAGKIGPLTDISSRMEKLDQEEKKSKDRLKKSLLLLTYICYREYQFAHLF